MHTVRFDYLDSENCSWYSVSDWKWKHVGICIIIPQWNVDWFMYI